MAIRFAQNLARVTKEAGKEKLRSDKVGRKRDETGAKGRPGQRIQCLQNTLASSDCDVNSRQHAPRARAGLTRRGARLMDGGSDRRSKARVHAVAALFTNKVHHRRKGRGLREVFVQQHKKQQRHDERGAGGGGGGGQGRAQPIPKLERTFFVRPVNHDG